MSLEADHPGRQPAAAAGDDRPEDPLAVECHRVTKYFYSRLEAHGSGREAGVAAAGGRPDGRAGTGPGGWWDAARMRWAGRNRRVAAVSEVCLAVRRGEIFGVIGPNGSGKSTLVRLLSTLLLPDEGVIRIFGLDAVKQQSQVRRLINRVSVEAAFFKKLSALENLSYAARLYDLPLGLARARAVEILDRLGMPRGKLTVPLEELSRGMQQKVAIARALFTSPVLLLLDEPTTGLDPRSKREVQAFIQHLHQEHDATVVLTSHDMQEVERLCHRVAFIKEGRLVAQGTVAELKQGAAGSAGDLEDLFFRLTADEAEA